MMEQLLDKSVRKQLDRELVKLHRLLARLDQLETCGVACDEFRAVAQDLCAQFTAILAADAQQPKPPKGG